MTAGRAHHRLAQLWQLPLLLLSLALFGYAAWLFIDPQPGLTIDQKIDQGRVFIKNDRPEAGIAHLNALLKTEHMDRPIEATVHLLLAEGLEKLQKQKKQNIPIYHKRIIDQTQVALIQGIQPDAALYKRMAESYEALDRPAEALEHYRRAMLLAKETSLPLLKKVIELQIDREERLAAEQSIDEYLKSADLTDAERGWAMGEKAQLLIDRNAYVEARTQLAEALRLDDDPVAHGQVSYRLGYAAWKLNDDIEAERHLRVARDQLRVQHPLDAEAAYLLGRIAQDRADHAQANSFYQVVLVSHPDSKVALLARLGRGVSRIALGEDDAGLTDLHDLVNAISQKSSRSKYIPEAIEGLKRATTSLASRGNYQGALEVLAHEQTLQPEPLPAFYARLGAIYEKRAEQIENSVADVNAAERIRRAQQVRDLRTKAGDAYIAHSRALTLADDKAYGDSLWHGIDLYDKATNVQRVISALELFVAERPDDALAPDALLRLGRAFQAAGMFDKAIAAFQRNQFRYPQSLAASKSAVPLAQAYIAKGPEGYGKAETVLLSVVENNPLVTPDAEEFKEALFEVAQLYYRTGRFEEAVNRLEELTQRYPKEERLGQLLFLMGDSYRKSASLLDTKAELASAADAVTAAATGAVDLAEALTAKRERLNKARVLYDRVIELYRVAPPSREIDKLYQRLSHFYRADCVYDLGDFEAAIRLYDAAAFRYQEDPSALAAYVQIVNAYCALGKVEEAKTANERAKWLLRRMPQERFTDGSFSMPKAYWEQWLKWTSDSGMW